MIYIIDNGESYSDHAIYFVKTEYGEKVVKDLIELKSDNYSEEEIQGIADNIKWLTEIEPTTLEKFVSPFHINDIEHYSIKKSIFKSLPCDFIEQWIKYWFKTNNKMGFRMNSKLAQKVIYKVYL